ncbi:MAG: CHAP domain-containing protein [Candidatus Shapirobacteria bacterium]|nr:CHAP domain-containing protein [Candidatus Shapirobacteria bacterium]
MATNSAKKLSLSKESALFLLEGLNFFKDNPQAKDWHKLDKDTFLLLARDIAQFYPDEEESLTQYLVRFESFLQRIVNREELAPSVPQNLEELVSAFSAFQKEKDAAVKIKEVDVSTSQDITLEDWIKNLQEKHLQQRTEREVEEGVVFSGLPKEQAASIKRSLAGDIAAVVPRTVIPSPEDKKKTAEKIRHVLDQGTIDLVLKEKESLIERITQKVRYLTVSPTVKPPSDPKEKDLIKTVSQVIKDKTPIKDPDQVQKTAQKIAQGLAQKVPKLTAQEKEALTEVEKITLTEEVVNASLPEIVEAITKPAAPIPEAEFTRRLVEEITQQANFSIIYSDRAPDHSKEAIIKTGVEAAIRDFVTVEEPSGLKEISKTISRAVRSKIPPQKEQSLVSLPEKERTSLLEGAIRGSLPEITTTIQVKAAATSLDPEESQEFIQELTSQAKQSLLDLSVSLREELETATVSDLPQLKNNQEGVILDQLDQNPLLPYQLTPSENQTPLNIQMRQVVNHYGIGQKSADIISYQNEEVAGFTNSVTGKTSPWWQNQINRFQAWGEDQNLINQTTNNFNLQIKFEANFPQLKGFYQRAVNWPGPRRWFNKITSPITGFFKEKVGGWWKNTAIAKGIAKGAKSKAGLFLKKTLGSFGIFKAGMKKTLQEGAKKGVTKALGWLAKKLAATKLGAALGSIAPGIGNAIGAIVGFGIDILKGGLNIFANTLQKITGGETEAEQTLKANLGPLGKIALSPITLIVVGVPILILVFALGLFQIEGSALVVDDETILSGLPFAQLPSENPIPDNHFAERLVGILQDCPATRPSGYINKTNFSQVAQCLKTAGISEAVINILEDSVNRFSSLQCVGFVQAVEANQGRILPGCGNAKDYADCSAITNSASYEYTNCQDLQPGAIGVSTRGTYGHVGIITGIETSETGITRVRFASAWGTSTQNGGRVTVTILPCDSFSALIQPKN